MCFPIASRPSSRSTCCPTCRPKKRWPPRITLAQQLHAPRSQVLVLADVFGATPCNVAQKLVDGVRSRLVAGVNLPMLLRAVTYRHEPLETLVQRALAGGTAGVMQVAAAAPQNQAKRKHSDQEIRDHQQ